MENIDNNTIQKFNIMDFTPRDKSPFPPSIKKKKVGGMASVKKKGAVIGFDEEEEDPNFDEFLADFEKKKKQLEDSQFTDIKMHEMEKTSLQENIKSMMMEK